MKRILSGSAIALFAFVLMVAPAAAQTSVAGTWTFTLQGPEGPVDAVAVLAQQGMYVTGTIELPQVDGAAFEEGMIMGTTLTFTLVVSMQGQEIALEGEGEVEGDAIKGEMYVADMGSIPFSGVRGQS